MSSDPSQAQAQAPRRSDEARRRAYWRANVRLLAVLLLVWAAVSFGGGILFAEALNRYRLPGTGFPLGFWFAQQGSIVVFVVLVFVYALCMNRIDARHGFAEEPRRRRAGSSVETPPEGT